MEPLIYLDHGATAFPKPLCVRRAVRDAMERCANPGRSGHAPAMAGAQVLFRCREAASRMFGCPAEQVVLTGSCTHGLNIAIRTLVTPGEKVVISGFEHNAVTRTLHLLEADVQVAGRRLFCPEDTLEQFEQALRKGAKAAVFTHVSNVFGYILPVAELARLCRWYGVPFVLDAAQSAGTLPVSLKDLGADFIAMPGHKGLLGPMGTGLLLCAGTPKPLLAGGTGSNSREADMPEYLPDIAEPGTMNVPGFAGLEAGIRLISALGAEKLHARESALAKMCARGLRSRGFTVFSGEDQAGTVSFLPGMDCEEAAGRLAQRGIALRAGLHCAPLAHESAGTLETGTLRVSFGYDSTPEHCKRLLAAVDQTLPHS